jgi:spore maturation protein CgeB
MKVKKVLFVMPDTADIGFGVFFARAFKKLGLEVLVIPLARQLHTHSPFKLGMAKLKRKAGLMAKQFEKNCIQVMSIQKDFNADLIIVVKCTNLSAKILKELHRSGAAIVQINTDHPQMDPGLKNGVYLSALKEYDLVVTFARLLIPVYYQMGAKRVYRLPFAYDPEIHKPVTLNDSERDIFTSSISYLGAWGFFQQQWLEPLLPYGLKIFGGLWHNLPFRHPLRSCVNLYRGWGEEMAKVCAGSQIVVNLMRAEHACAHSMKTFEIPACGGFMLTNRTEEQKEFFQEDTEAVYFDTQNELIDRVNFYLANSNARDRIREAGIRAAMLHTYLERARELLSIL